MEYIETSEFPEILAQSYEEPGLSHADLSEKMRYEFEFIDIHLDQVPLS